jgi:Na+/H+-dicarboxylate symporter
MGFLAGLFLMIYFNHDAVMNFISFRNSDASNESWLKVGTENLPYWIFVIYAILISWYSFTKNLSLIPILGLTMCVYLMSALHITTWEGFTIWLVAGLIIYFFYSYKNSKLRGAD